MSEWLNRTRIGVSPSVRPEAFNTLLAAATVVGDGGIIDLGATCSQFTCTTSVSGQAPTAYSVKLKGSIDGSHFVDLATAAITIVEKVTNGTPSSATGWTLGSGWAYSSSTFVKSAGNAGTVSQAVGTMVSIPVIGETYIVSFNVTAASVGGSITVSYAGATAAALAIPAAGTGFYSVALTAVNASGALTLTPGVAADVYTISTISCDRNEDGFHVVNKPVRYIKGSIVSVTGGGSSTAITMACEAGGN